MQPLYLLYIYAILIPNWGISDVLRYIIVQIEENGFSTDQIINDKETDYTEIIVRVTHKQKQFWQGLPNRNRRKIMEKAILAFTKNKS